MSAPALCYAITLLIPKNKNVMYVIILSSTELALHCDLNQSILNWIAKTNECLFLIKLRIHVPSDRWSCALKNLNARLDERFKRDIPCYEWLPRKLIEGLQLLIEQLDASSVLSDNFAFDALEQGMCGSYGKQTDRIDGKTKSSGYVIKLLLLGLERCSQEAPKIRAPDIVGQHIWRFSDQPGWTVTRIAIVLINVGLGMLVGTGGGLAGKCTFMGGHTCSVLALDASRGGP